MTEISKIELEIETDRMMIRTLMGQLAVTVEQVNRIRDRQNRIKADLRKYQRELSKHERQLERWTT